jgi:hypothetical protein
MHAVKGKTQAHTHVLPAGAAPADGLVEQDVTRRAFLKHAATVGAVLGLNGACQCEAIADEPDRVKPIGEAQGIHPGRVVWVHDPQATDWKGPGDGRWYEAQHTKQDRVSDMLSRAVLEVAGENTLAKAWDKLFRHLNQKRGIGAVGYQPGQKIAIKPNWVGMCWWWGKVDPGTYTLVNYQDYMNTSPQVIISLLQQLVGIGVQEADLTVCDTLAYLVHEYYDILHREFPKVQYVDHAGKFGRIQVKPSSVLVFWSCRPLGFASDYLPTCFAEAEYLINLANLKAHACTGVTLCGKNHFGSLVRWPVQQGYYDMHRHSFAKQTKLYREQVDLMGHAHLGGKTVLYLIDGLYPGKHSVDPAPRRWGSPPFQGHWASSVLASQDPVAIDSVGCDFLCAEWEDYPRQVGVDDYLHEAALAASPPSGTFYDPDHPTPVKRLTSLGVHEHWNNPLEKKYSRNLGTGNGIELVAVVR